MIDVSSVNFTDKGKEPTSRVRLSVFVILVLRIWLFLVDCPKGTMLIEVKASKWPNNQNALMPVSPEIYLQLLRSIGQPSGTKTWKTFTDKFNFYLTQKFHITSTNFHNNINTLNIYSRNYKSMREMQLPPAEFCKQESISLGKESNGGSIHEKTEG